MLRYFKKQKASDSSDNAPKELDSMEEQVQNEEPTSRSNSHLGDEVQNFTKCDLSTLPGDPGERPKIESYHINQRDEVRRAYLQKGPCQPRHHSFQRINIGGKLRQFNPSWFEDYKYWLEYSIKEEAAFCLCCYLFKLEIKNQGGADSFTSSGFKSWNKRERLDVHNGSSAHKLAIHNCQNLMNQSQSISFAFDKQSDLVRNEYRIRLHASIDCVRFLLRQGFPFRGHDEHKDSSNKGNFLELLHFYADNNEKVGSFVLKNAPKNSQMIAPSIQKDIVHAAAIETIKVITGEIRDDFFGILVDESRDVSCKEQIGLVLRYVNSEGSIIERFIGIKHVTDTSAISLKAGIDSMLLEYGLSPSKIRGQGYDGASNMRGEFNGLKTLIMRETQSAYYIHCFAHQLQLTLVFVAKHHFAINDFFELISRLINMIGSSFKRRDKLREKQAKIVAELIASDDIETGRGLNHELSLKRAGDTRWGSHYGSLLNVMKMYSAIIEVLEEIEKDGAIQDQRAEAHRLLEVLETFKFVFCLYLMVKILGFTNELNLALQKRDQEIVNAISLVSVAKKSCNF